VRVTGDARDSARASKRGYYKIIEEIFRDGTKARVGFLCGVQFDVPRANPSVMDNVAATNALLCNALHVRRLFVHPDCKRVRTDMERLITKAEKAKQIGKVYDGPYGIEKGDENLSHASDCVRYWVNRVASLTRSAFQRQTSYRIPNA